MIDWRVTPIREASISHTVASLGTALSIEQAQRLIRSGAKRLWVALDGDKAGQAATARLIEGLRPLAIGGQIDLLVVSIPPGDDPDSLVHRHGAEAFRRCLARARHWLAWELEQLLADLQVDPEDLSALQRCERQGSELLALLPEGALRQKAERRLQEALGVVPHGGRAPSKRGNDAKVAQAGEISHGAHVAPAAEHAVAHAERRALRLFLCCPELREELSVLVLLNPLHREAMGWLWCLNKRLGGEVSTGLDHPRVGGSASTGGQEDGLRVAVLAALPQMDPPLEALISPLVQCGEAVRRKLAKDPEAELMSILDVLESVE